jgi:hypothetical protein
VRDDSIPGNFGFCELTAEWQMTISHKQIMEVTRREEKE